MKTKLHFKKLFFGLLGIGLLGGSIPLLASSSSTSLATLKANHPSNNNRLTATNRDTLITTVEGLLQQLQDLKNTVTILGTTVTSNKTSLESKINELGTGMTNIKNQITDLQTDTNTKITNLQEKLPISPRKIKN